VSGSGASAYPTTSAYHLNGDDSTILRKNTCSESRDQLTFPGDCLSAFVSCRHGASPFQHLMAGNSSPGLQKSLSAGRGEAEAGRREEEARRRRWTAREREAATDQRTLPSDNFLGIPTPLPQPPLPTFKSRNAVSLDHRDDTPL
jgi:hypothetical protein